MFEMWAKRFESLCEDVAEHEVHAVELAAILGNTIHMSTWNQALGLAGLASPTHLMETMARRRLFVFNPNQQTFAFTNAMFRAAILMRVQQQGRRAQWASHAADALEDERHAIGLRARLLAMAGRAHEALAPLAQAVEDEIETGTRGGARELFRIREQLIDTIGLDPDSSAAFHSEILRWNLLGTRAERMEYISTHFDPLNTWAIRLADSHSQARILRSYAFSHFDRGEIEAGTIFLEQALSIAEENPGPSWALCLYAKAAMESRRGLFDEAKHTTKEMLQVAQKNGETVRAAQAYSHLSEIALQTHAYAEASRFLSESRQRYEAIGSRKGIAITALSEGEIHRAQGNLDAAILSYKEARERGENCEASVALDARINLGISYVVSGRLSQAKIEFNESLSRHGKDLLVYTMTAIRLGLINCLIAEENWGETMHELDELDTVFTNTKMVDRDFGTLASMAAQGAQAANQTLIARRAWKMAMLQWDGLGQDEQAEAAASALEDMLNAGPFGGIGRLEN
jgi:tetratricopeptide (TPR) repeat protein